MENVGRSGNLILFTNVHLLILTIHNCYLKFRFFNKFTPHVPPYPTVSSKNPSYN